MIKNEKLILIGGGGHCSSAIDVIEENGLFSIAGIIDLKEKIGQKNLGYEVIGSDEDMESLVKEYKYFLITIGQIRTVRRRVEIHSFLQERGAITPVIISPHAYVSKYSKIGPGTIVMHFAQVNANTIIGENCIINSKALIEHDAKIGNHCHISTGAIINGGTIIGESSFIGSGSVCRENINIPSGSFIKANSLVI